MDEQQLKKRVLERGNIPKHIAVIMDGNGRWANSRYMSRVEGHREGINSVREIVEAAGELNVKYLTLYTFSKENWKRPRSEVSALMRLLLKTIRAEVDALDRNNVRLNVIGKLADLPLPARKAMERGIERLKSNTGLTLNLALSYGSRLEITNAMQIIAGKVKSGKLRPEDIDESVVAEHLYTASMPDPELLIRTSGEMRISNFLLWQLAYTEIYITDVFWPDFRKYEFFEAVAAYQSRDRRFGGVSEQMQKQQALLKSA